MILLLALLLQIAGSAPPNADLLDATATSSTATDAFGRQRVSQPVTLFDSQAQYGIGTESWYNKTNGSATIAHSAADSTVLMTVTASGESVPLLSRVPLTLDIDGANPTSLSVVCTSMSGTSNVSAVVRWSELR